MDQNILDRKKNRRKLGDYWLVEVWIRFNINKISRELFLCAIRKDEKNWSRWIYFKRMGIKINWERFVPNRKNIDWWWDNRMKKQNIAKKKEEKKDSFYKKRKISLKNNDG